MSKPVLVAVAWPYASGSRHLGHLAGAYLPADIFARQQRIMGNEVLMVSGSDVHGTPITVRADAEGVKPQDIVDRYHQEFREKTLFRFHTPTMSCLILLSFLKIISTPE
mgnify:CR=1 FL=1